MLLKAAPQDLPYSQPLMLRVFFLYVLSDMAATGAVFEYDMALVMALLGITILLVFTYGILYLLNHKPRFVQTITALAGTGIIFNLISWPLLVQLHMEDMPQSAAAIVLLLVLLLMSWVVLVTAHIYKNSLETSMLHALLLSFSLFFISITLSELIFPGQ